MKLKNDIKFGLDMIIIISLILLMVPISMGQTIHEWAGLVIAGIFICHISLNWNWVKKVSLRFLGKLPGRTRLNYILTLLMFIGFVFIIISGVLTAKVIDFSWLGITNSGQGIWRIVHSTVSYITFVIAGIHTGLNYRWIASTVKKLLPTAI